MCQLTGSVSKGGLCAAVKLSSCPWLWLPTITEAPASTAAEPGRCSLDGQWLTIRWWKIFMWKAHFKLKMDDMLSYVLMTQTVKLVWREEKNWVGTRREATTGGYELAVRVKGSSLGHWLPLPLLGFLTVFHSLSLMLRAPVCTLTIINLPLTFSEFPGKQKVPTESKQRPPRALLGCDGAGQREGQPSLR